MTTAAAAVVAAAAAAAVASRERVRDRLQTGAESYKITVVVVFSNKCQRKSHFMCSIHTLQAGFWIVFFALFRFFLSLAFLFPIYKCFFFLLFHYLLRSRSRRRRFVFLASVF